MSLILDRKGDTVRAVDAEAGEIITRRRDTIDPMGGVAKSWVQRELSPYKENTSATQERTEAMPGVFTPKDSKARFHSPSLTSEGLESWLAEDSEFEDTYADWASGTGNPLRGNTSRTPGDPYARMILRSYLPGFGEAEEAADPYRENTSRTPRRNGPSPYSLNEKRAAVFMTERLGIRKTARKLGVPESTLRGWINAEGSYKENTSRTPKTPGRPTGQRPEKPCTGCGTPTRTHVSHKPLCRSCYVSTEDYRRDRSQWQSDVMMLKKAVGE